MDGTPEKRFAEAILRFLDGNLDMLDGDADLREEMEALGKRLSHRYGLPPLGTTPPVELLKAARRELLDRLDESGADPMQALTAPQWTIIGEGLPFALDEVIADAAVSIREFLPDLDSELFGHVVLLNACATVKGALAHSWRR